MTKKRTRKTTSRAPRTAGGQQGRLLYVAAVLVAAAVLWLIWFRWIP